MRGAAGVVKSGRDGGREGRTVAVDGLGPPEQAGHARGRRGHREAEGEDPARGPAARRLGLRAVGARAAAGRRASWGRSDPSDARVAGAVGAEHAERVAANAPPPGSQATSTDIFATAAATWRPGRVRTRTVRGLHAWWCARYV